MNQNTVIHSTPVLFYRQNRQSYLFVFSYLSFAVKNTKNTSPSVSLENCSR